MKVFIRTSDLTGEEPTVVASYPDDSDVPANAHGEGMTIITVPSNLLVHHRREDEIPALPKLARGWRDRAGPVMLEAEAKRRITDVIPLDEQIASLHEVQDFIVKYGTDVAKWPVEARNRKAEIDQKLNYIHEVRARASAHSKAVPANPVSDKIWPTRLRQGWTENR